MFWLLKKVDRLVSTALNVGNICGIPVLKTFVHFVDIGCCKSLFTHLLVFFKLYLLVPP
jgi:hypothetical protein